MSRARFMFQEDFNLRKRNRDQKAHDHWIQENLDWYYASCTEHLN